MTALNQFRQYKNYRWKMLECWPASLIYNATRAFQADKYSAVISGLSAAYLASELGGSDTLVTKMKRRNFDC
jgi:hypothetical protein